MAPSSVVMPSQVYGGRTRIDSVDLGLFGFGALINLYAYLSLLPIIVAMLFYAAGVAMLLWPKVGGVHERRIFSRVFAVGFVMAGVAAAYAAYRADPYQLGSDAATFFRMAAGSTTAGLTLDDLGGLSGALAVKLWAAVYDLFAALGFPRERYVGVSLNITAVALAGVIGVKMCRQVFGDDPNRFGRLTLLYAACGIFWLFAALHLRDAVMLLAVTGLAYAWLHFLAKPDLGFRLLQIVIASITAALFIGFLRTQFVFVPLAMAAVAVASLTVGRKDKRNRRVAYVLVVIGVAVAGALLVALGEEIQLALLLGQEIYMDLAAEEHGAGSLGMILIANQPLPIRLSMGSVYLFMFPIPFWSGFQLESAYHLFKSFNVLFFYFVLPLLALAIRQLWKHEEQRSPALLFVLLLSIGLTVSIAATSMETRHLGAFLTPVFVLALLPDLRVRSTRRNYRKLLGVMLGGVVAVHVAWSVLKMA
jgi:hypothetical protein